MIICRRSFPVTKLRKIQFVNIKKQLRLNPCDNGIPIVSFQIFGARTFEVAMAGFVRSLYSMFVRLTQHICSCSHLTLAASTIATIGVLR